MVELKQGFILLMLLSLVSWSNLCHGRRLWVFRDPMRPRYLTIFNDLDRGMTLRVHCKSGDDDLGERIIPPRGEWGFTFVPNMWGTTLFFCRFGFNRRSRWADVYSSDMDDVNDYYDWSIRPGGPCRIFPGGSACRLHKWRLKP